MMDLGWRKNSSHIRLGLMPFLWKKVSLDEIWKNALMCDAFDEVGIGMKDDRMWGRD